MTILAVFLIGLIIGVTYQQFLTPMMSSIRSKFGDKEPLLWYIVVVGYCGYEYGLFGIFLTVVIPFFWLDWKLPEFEFYKQSEEPTRKRRKS